MKKNKYNARKAFCRHCAKPHDSKKEAARCDELHRMQESGLIRNLQTQAVIQLIPAAQYRQADPRMGNERGTIYKADFKYTECSSGCVVIEDVKSKATRIRSDYIIKRKLVKYMYCRKGACVFLET